MRRTDRPAGPGTVLTLILTGRKARGDTVRLLGRRGPVGRVYDDTGGRLVVGFPAAELRAFLVKEMEAS